MQVLLNLQSNALKFTRRGGVTLKAEIVEEEVDFGAQRYLQISVTDTGVGIPWEDQDKLFKLFGFVQSTQQYNKNGIGLGLVISERIVKKFGGTINFHSIPYPERNHGTTFTFTFKLETKESYERMQAEEQDTLGAYQLNSKILAFDYEVPDCPESPITQKMKKQHQLNFDILGPSTERLSEKKDQGDFKMSPSLTKKTLQRHFSALDLKASVSLVQVEAIDPGSEFSEGQSSKESGSKRILIVDDQIFNIQALESILESKFNISKKIIDHAMNGEEALSIIEKDMNEN